MCQGIWRKQVNMHEEAENKRKKVRSGSQRFSPMRGVESQREPEGYAGV